MDTEGILSIAYGRPNRMGVTYFFFRAVRTEYSTCCSRLVKLSFENVSVGDGLHTSVVQSMSRCMISYTGTDHGAARRVFAEAHTVDMTSLFQYLARNCQKT